jgi:hypothetical protein
MALYGIASSHECDIVELIKNEDEAITSTLN